jgi:iron complex outermembrane receptor protein
MRTFANERPCRPVRRARSSPRSGASPRSRADGAARDRRRARRTRADSLADLSLEQLARRRRDDRGARRAAARPVAASVFVIGAEDIRRSGATTIAEALRLAPTLDVARADSSQYAISARGFNNVLANKMLVLIDGRTVYTPLFSGVFWEAQDVMLEDVERIEVVTGPSTALWGSNAVNGLIHIVTRSAAATRGGFAALRAGNRDRHGGLRWGGALGDTGSVRLYAKAYERDATHRADGSSVGDAAQGVQGGFRYDWSRAGEAVTVQGDLYRGSIEQGALGARTFAGGNLVGRWQRAFADGSEASVQVYADHTERDHPQNFAERLDTVDAVVQYAFKPAAGHAVTVGGGYRYARDRVETTSSLAFVPDDRSLHWTRSSRRTSSTSRRRSPSPHRAASRAIRTQAPSSCPACASAGPPRPAICCGPRTRARCARRRGSIASSSFPPSRRSPSPAAPASRPRSPTSSKSATAASGVRSSPTR